MWQRAWRATSRGARRTATAGKHSKRYVHNEWQQGPTARGRIPNHKWNHYDELKLMSYSSHLAFFMLLPPLVQKYMTKVEVVSDPTLVESPFTTPNSVQIKSLLQDVKFVSEEPETLPEEVPETLPEVDVDVDTVLDETQLRRLLVASVPPATLKRLHTRRAVVARYERSKGRRIHTDIPLVDLIAHSRSHWLREYATTAGRLRQVLDLIESPRTRKRILRKCALGRQPPSDHTMDVDALLAS